MLFDLKTGKRRRVVQIVFGFLAFIFFISFVGFGIGSDVSGGIFDAIGLGGGSSESTSSQYEQQIEDAETDLEQNPRDPQALTDLARYKFLSGQDQLEFDEETGVASLTEEARGEWNDALDAWEQLLKDKPKEVDPQVAAQMVCAYVPLLPACGVQAPADQIDLDGAVQTQRLVAEEDPTAAGYAQLAQFLYFDAQFEAGDEATAEALKRAKAGERDQLEKQLSQVAEQAKKFEKQQQQAQDTGGGEPSLEDPFGGLGGSAGGLGGIAPPPE